MAARVTAAGERLEWRSPSTSSVKGLLLDGLSRV
jgi:hypothetical protein